VPDQLVTFAPRPGSLVPAGTVADAVVTADGLFAPIVERTPVANLADAPLADVVLGPGEQLDAGPGLDEWLVLTAAALVGIGLAALELGCAYAVERHAFGSPIGSFQGVSHPLADDATALDGAQLLARKAAWALDTSDPRARELAAMAFAFGSRAAEQATYDALHTHGGYGFTLESDVQLHWRRARGWARVWGDSEAAFRRAADARYP
jgi:alkylation response protein AidB-like acyl-CoA dehydrogenase